MIAVTISIGGEQYETYAKKSAEQVHKHTGLDTYILGDKELDSVWTGKGFKGEVTNKEKACYFKYFIFDLLPFAEDVLYHDADWCCIADWNPVEFKGRQELIVVRDRTWHLQDDPQCWTKLGKFGDQWSYFNAGFMIMNRRNHHQLMKYAKNAYHLVDRKFFEQCSTNHVFHKTGHPIHYLDRSYNCMDVGPITGRFTIKAVHSSHVYPYYDRDEAPQFTGPIVIDPYKMVMVAGYYKLYSEEKIECVYLMYDGTTNKDFLWCMDSMGQFHFFDYFYQGFKYYDRILRVG